MNTEIPGVKMTRIFVIKRKRLLFAGIALIAVLLLIALIVIISGRSDKTQDDKTQETLAAVYNSERSYVPGVYTGQISLGSYNATLEVLVDDTQVKNVRLTAADEAVETMYPLVGSSVSAINDSLRSGVDIDELRSDNEQGYTYSLLMEEIDAILDKARLD